MAACWWCHKAHDTGTGYCSHKCVALDAAWGRRKLAEERNAEWFEGPEWFDEEDQP